MNTVLFSKALDLMEEKNFEEAEPLLLQLHDQDPLNARINFSLGVIDLHYNNLEPALAYFTEAARVATEKSIVFTHLADVQGRLHMHDEQLKNAKKALSLDKGNTIARQFVGNAYYNLRRPVLARQAYLQLLEINPDSAPAYLGLHTLELSLGNEEKADEYLLKAFEIDPENAGVLVALADRPKLKPAFDRAEVMTSALAEPDKDLSYFMRGQLAFYTGKVLDRKNDYKSAFAYYGQHRDDLYKPFDLKLWRWQVDRYKAFFNREFFEARQDIAFKSAKPVFVFGMPRSGTTMTEQIIAQHPKAAGAGEIPFFTQLDTNLKPRKRIKPEYFTKILNTTEKEFKKIGRNYLKILDGADRNAIRVVDKMPHNFETLWLIALLFPNATFIHMKRAPVDNCVSIYTTPLNSSHNYNIDQTTLGTYYCLYREMMDHWQEVLPVTIRQQSYEAIVANQESESRALLDHVGLPWDPACLEFNRGDAPVITFSSQQVRQPLYSSSVDRWKKYEAHIGPLIEALGPYGPKHSG